MPFERVWETVRERAGERTDAVFLTPRTDRSFTVGATRKDRIEIRYRESGAERTLWRRQFEVLHDRLTTGETIELSGLAPGVEPYVSVLSLSDEYAVAEGAFQRVDGETPGSPFVREVERPDRQAVHDDALLLADHLEQYDLADLSALSSPTLVDLYVLLSEVQRGSDELRRTLSEELLDRIGPDGRLRGRFGVVSRASRERRHLKDEDAVFDALEEHDIPREWVLGVDPDKLDVVLAVTDLEPAAVYDSETTTYVQKTDVEESEKQTYLSGLRSRLSAADSEEAARLREDLDDIEARIDDLLATK